MANGKLVLSPAGAGQLRVHHGKYEIGRVVRAKRGTRFIAVTCAGHRVGSGATSKLAAAALVSLAGL